MPNDTDTEKRRDKMALTPPQLPENVKETAKTDWIASLTKLRVTP